MIRKRTRLTAAQREDLYDAEVVKAIAEGRGRFPICAICSNPISIGQKWHVSHDKFLPHAIGGEPSGIAHARCNTDWNHNHDTPLVAKVKRQRQKHIGAWQSHNSLPGSRDDKFKKTMRGEVVLRSTGEPAWRTRT